MVALELVREDEDEDQGTHRCDASELSTSPRGEAEAAKARGNESFARGEFERAREAYTEALARVGAEERADSRSSRISSVSNLRRSVEGRSDVIRRARPPSETFPRESCPPSAGERRQLQGCTQSES